MANLLVGNGINRLGNYSQSWEQILQQLSEATGETLNMDGKSYLHIYEEVYSKAGDKEIGDKINKIIAALSEANGLKATIKPNSIRIYSVFMK